MTANAYGVEITDEVLAEAAAINAGLEHWQNRFNGLCRFLGADDFGTAQSALEDAVEDVALDISRFIETDEES